MGYDAEGFGESTVSYLVGPLVAVSPIDAFELENSSGVILLESGFILLEEN